MRVPHTQKCPNCRHEFSTKLGVTAEDIAERKRELANYSFVSTTEKLRPLTLRERLSKLFGL